MRNLASIKNKKGQLSLLVPGILTLVLGAALLVFGLIILESLQTTTATQSGSKTLEKLGTVVNESGVRVAQATECGFTGFTVSQVKNNSGAIVIAPANYTYTSAGVVKYVSTADLLYNNTVWNVTYSYNYGDESCRSANKTITGVGSFADFWEIIVLAVVVTIVLSLILVLGTNKSRAR